ncbi:MAG: tesB [Actinomycetia bacterium]|nr:tesB [Actinomycetes bacterium]
MGFDQILHLEQHGADTWVGTGPSYPWGGLYGGQIVAQALVAATHSVEPGLRPHSLRAYFIRAGDAAQPVRYEVDRLRNGRSFTTRRVVARQAVGAILNLEASFTGGEASGDRQRLTMPVVPHAESLPPEPWSNLFDRRQVPVELGSGQLDLWLRLTTDLPVDPGGHEAAFAYLSDDAPSEAIKALVVEPGQSFATFEADSFLVSLDHTVWFHRPVQADRWHLHSFRCDRFVAGRALTIGEVWSEDGTHVATVAQEMLMRRHRGTQTS